MGKRISTNKNYYIHSFWPWFATLFALLSVMSVGKTYFAFDLLVSSLLQSIRSPWIHAWMKLSSEVGNGLNFPILILAFASFLLIKRRYYDSFATIMLTSFSITLGILVKMIVRRPRPSADLVGVDSFLYDSSYPSLHVLMYTVFFGLVIYLISDLTGNKFVQNLTKAISIFFILSIGFSRIYLGAHWASDVLGGYLLGFLCLNIAVYLGRLAKSRQR